MTRAEGGEEEAAMKPSPQAIAAVVALLKEGLLRIPAPVFEAPEPRTDAERALREVIRGLRAAPTRIEVCGIPVYTHLDIVNPMILSREELESYVIGVDWGSGGSWSGQCTVANPSEGPELTLDGVKRLVDELALVGLPEDPVHFDEIGAHFRLLPPKPR